MGGTDGVRRTRTGGPGSLEFSELAFVLRPPAADAGAERLVAEVRRARSAGVTTFAAASASDVPFVNSVLGRAFPERDAAVTLLRPSPLPAERSQSPGRPPPARTEPETPLPSSVRFAGLEERDPEDGRAAPGPFALRCRSTDDLRAAPGHEATVVLSGRFSLLAPELALEAARSVGESRLRWIAGDVFAEGRLNGDRFAPLLARGPRTAVRPVRELEAEFAPVARLGFLARPGERTLAQAALHYVLDHPWVVTAVLPFPAPDRWEEIVGFRRSPPLTDDEKARLEGRAVVAPGEGR